MDVHPLTPEQPVRTGPHRSVGLAVTTLVVVVGLAMTIVFREHNRPFGFERVWMSTLVEHRSAPWTIAMLVLDGLGGGWVAVLLAGATVMGLLVWRRPWAATYFAVAVATSAGLVYVTKQVVGRPRPEDILVATDLGSFPSGHSANAAVTAVALGIIFRRTWVWVVGGIYTVGMMFSRTYLGAHWISDTIAGALLGAGVAVLLLAVFASRLRQEERNVSLPGRSAAVQ